MSKNRQETPKGGGLGPMRGPGASASMGARPKNFGKTMIKLLKYSKMQMPAIIISLIFTIAYVVLTLFVPNFTGRATDGLLEGIIQRTAYESVEKMLPEMPGNISSMDELCEYVAAATGKNKDSITLQDLIDMTGGSLPEGEISESIKNIPKKYQDALFAAPLSYKAQIDVKAIGDILIMMCILILISGALNYIQGFILAGVAQKISYRLRQDIDKKISKQPLKFYDTTSNGEVLSYLTNDVDSISTTLNQSLSQLIVSITTIIGVLIMMIRISLILTAITVILVPLCMLLMFLVVRISQKHFIKQQKYLGKVNGHVEEMYAGHQVVTLYNGQKESMETFDEFNNNLTNSAQKSQFLSGLMMPIMNFLGNIGFVVVCVVGGLISIGKVGTNPISIGQIQEFLQYLRRFNQPVSQMANIVNSLQSTAAAGERVFSFLDAPEEIETGNAVPENVEGNVEFKNVKFGYDPEKIIINDFSANIKAGDSVAIVGPTGAGKTTIVKLLMRYYDIGSGSILLDGRDISEFSRSGLRREFGMVLQDTWLQSGTIMDNIRYGSLEATDEQVVEAAKIACADGFIRQLPGSYDFVINEDADNISQGQKQLLTIARAVLSNPKVLIFDEATSSVDTRTELLIQKAMGALMGGKTSFIIAHRLSTVRDANLILVMRDGDIVEQGTHAELLEQKGFYEGLYNSQFSEE